MVKISNAYMHNAPRYVYIYINKWRYHYIYIDKQSTHYKRIRLRKSCLLLLVHTSVLTQKIFGKIPKTNTFLFNQMQIIVDFDCKKKTVWPLYPSSINIFENYFRKQTVWLTYTMVNGIFPSKISSLICMCVCVTFTKAFMSMLLRLLWFLQWVKTSFGYHLKIELDTS